MVLLRKFTIILIVTFGRNFTRQLHIVRLSSLLFHFSFFIFHFSLSHSHRLPFSSFFPFFSQALGALVIFYHLQQTASPYPKTPDGNMLQKVELESIIVLLTMTWVAVFFTVSECSEGDQSCRDVSLVLGVILVVLNVMFLGKAVWYTAKKFNEKEQVVRKLRTGARKMATQLATTTMAGGQRRASRSKHAAAKELARARETRASIASQRKKRINWNLNPAPTNQKIDDESQTTTKGHTKTSTLYSPNNLFQSPVTADTSANIQKHWDNNVSCFYFHNNETGETWWEEIEEGRERTNTIDSNESAED